MKRQFSPKEKAEVALAAIKGQLTISQISSTYQVHPTQISLWKKQAMAGLTEIFYDKRKKDSQNQEQSLQTSRPARYFQIIHLLRSCSDQPRRY